MTGNIYTYTHIHARTPYPSSDNLITDSRQRVHRDWVSSRLSRCHATYFASSDVRCEESSFISNSVGTRDLSAASIANVARPRRPSSLWNKGSLKSREAMPGTWPSDWTVSLSLSLSLSLSRPLPPLAKLRGRDSRSRLAFRFSFARSSHRTFAGRRTGWSVASTWRECEIHGKPAVIWGYSPELEFQRIENLRATRRAEKRTIIPGVLDTEKCGKGARKRTCPFREP